MILPAISVMQPWPYAIFHLGKDVENRSWRLSQQYFGVPVLIHAGKRRDWDGDIYLRDELGFDFPAELPLGGIVGVLVFDSCCADYSSKWAVPGLFHWGIKTAMPLELLLCKGQLGFFKVDYPHPLPENLCPAS